MKANNPPIPILDGIRGFSCLMILFAHAVHYGWLFTITKQDIPGDGQLAVMLFFTLSGFLMAYHYLPGRLSWRYWLAFMIRRIFRIYPVFLLIVAFGVVLAGMSHSHRWDVFSWHEAAMLWLLIDKMWIFWTVVVEMRFYFFFCFLGIGLLWLQRRISPLTVVTAFWVLLLFVDSVTYTRDDLNYLPCFIGGMVAAMLTVHYDVKKWFPQSYWNAAVVVCFAILIGFLPPFMTYLRGHYFEPWQHILIYSPVIAIIIFSLGNTGGPVAWCFSNRFIQWVGRISYSVYLVHCYVFPFTHFFFTPFTITGSILSFAVVLLVGWLLYLTVEMPFYRLGIKLSRHIDKADFIQKSHRNAS
jgi:peptidoglycan/LPS O-acetylase OafA/YrhL